MTPLVNACLQAADSLAPRLDTVTVAVAGPQLTSGRPSPWPFAGSLIENHLLATEPTPAECDASATDQPAPARAVRYRVYARTSESIVLGPADSTRTERIRFVPLPLDRDERDALDESPGRATRIDVLVTRNARAIDYARGRREFVTRPLPWDRVYVLAAAGASVPDADTRVALARDAVRADTRGADGPFWWVGDPHCSGPTAARPGGAAIVAYAEGDAIARDLADRIVALAAMDRSPAWLGRLTGRSARSAPLPAAGLDSALRRGQVSGVVVAWPRLAPVDCAGLAGSSAGASAPLVDSRAHLIVRRGVPPLALGADGTFRILLESGR